MTAISEDYHIYVPGNSLWTNTAPHKMIAAATAAADKLGLLDLAGKLAEDAVYYAHPFAGSALAGLLCDRLKKQQYAIKSVWNVTHSLGVYALSATARSGKITA